MLLVWHFRPCCWYYPNVNPFTVYFQNVNIFLGWEQQLFGPDLGGRGGASAGPRECCRWRRDSQSHIQTTISSVNVGFAVELRPRLALWGTSGIGFWGPARPIPSISFQLRHLEFGTGHDSELYDGGETVVPHFDPNLWCNNFKVKNISTLGSKWYLRGDPGWQWTGGGGMF